MTISLLGTFTGFVLGWALALLSLFLILLVLIQRGKGGGLTGALGGPGGQSAFGSKAGDTFTRITVVVALIWGGLCAVTVMTLGTKAPPPVVTEVLKPGPGDEDIEPGNSLVEPSAGGNTTGGSGIGGIGGIGDLNLDSLDESVPAGDQSGQGDSQGESSTDADASENGSQPDASASETSDDSGDSGSSDPTE